MIKVNLSNMTDWRIHLVSVSIMFTLPIYLVFSIILSNNGVLGISTMQMIRDDFNNTIIPTAMKDIVLGLPASKLTLVLDNIIDNHLLPKLLQQFYNSNIMVAMFIIQDKTQIYKLTEDVKKQLELHQNGVYLLLLRPALLEITLKMIKNEDLVQRNILYLFYWNKQPVSKRFQDNVIEAMRICVIKSKKAGTYQIFYNQATSNGQNRFKLVNWWTKTDGLFRHPLLPPAEKVYQDFHGRTFHIPVLHKPPWNFVTYQNDGIIIEGGRDDKLLTLLAAKLNFRIEYFDPPDRSQGSAFINGTIKGVLGLIWQREVHLFVGDLTVTYERSQAVEFSFLTLADNEAFLTHAPSLLNEALALVRSFHWKVWPVLLLTIVTSGLFVFFIIEAPRMWCQNDSTGYNNPLHLYFYCNWCVCAIFLRQSTMIPSELHKVRFVVVLLSLGATYVIGDMYLANLTSMLARPARESPIGTLEQLTKAMQTQGFQLLVEKYSASHGNVENGTGLYKQIWNYMKKQSMNGLIESTEDGMKLVRDRKDVALIGGRETFFYDTRRFGAHNFHLSEKLYTRYSAIALQKGCPFISKFNEILMQLFEAGILTKITEEEYQKLEEKKRTQSEEVVDVAEGKEQVENESKLKPMSMKALQGAFIVLIIGNCIAGVLLITELFYYKLTL